MIRYVLECAAGHSFESWFQSSAAYDRLEAAGELRCAHCGNGEVRKALMSPRIAAHRSSERDAESTSDESPRQTSLTPAAAARSHGVLMAPESAELRELRTAFRAMRDAVLANSEYVGPRFAEEARRIHFEEAPDRGIYGEATAEDVKSLAEDGIDVLPLPRLPEDHS
ncbi:MAG: DUF1178 family protein [Hyphomicrobiaceae bacterium]